MRRNLLVSIRFKGTNYCGYQVQQNGVTITQVFQDALEQVLGRREDIMGCSRTDSGVHANRYCLNLRTDHPIPCENFIRAMNFYLPPDVAVTACEEVDEQFHARYSCKGKEYLYRVLNSPCRDPFLEDLVFLYPKKLDVPLLDQAAKAFVGTHDFAGFSNKNTDVKDTVRTIFAFDVTREGDLITFAVSGDGFLYNMVRIMVGTLIYKVGAGTVTPQQMPGIIASRDRRQAGMTAPAKGLYLNRVFY